MLRSIIINIDEHYRYLSLLHAYSLQISSLLLNCHLFSYHMLYSLIVCVVLSRFSLFILFFFLIIFTIFNPNCQYRKMSLPDSVFNKNFKQRVHVHYVRVRPAVVIYRFHCGKADHQTTKRFQDLKISNLKYTDKYRGSSMGSLPLFWKEFFFDFFRSISRYGLENIFGEKKLDPSY